MASNATTTTTIHSNTTFVQADPSTFRAVVQKLTGAPADPSPGKLPLTAPVFRLHERRRSSKKLELDLNNYATAWPRGVPGSEMLVGSPVSTLEFLARRSPATPLFAAEQEEKAIAEKGFFLHPSPITTPRGPDPPELLPLFPLRSPTDCNTIDDSSSSS